MFILCLRLVTLISANKDFDKSSAKSWLDLCLTFNQQATNIITDPYFLASNLASLWSMVGGIILLVFCCINSTPGKNRFGPNPKESFVQ